MPDEARILTVGQLNDFAKMTLENNPVLNNVWVRGEISNFKHHFSGHMYFSVKDNAACIAAVMFRSSAEKLKFQPYDGMKVLLRGKVTLFPKDGKYQIYVSSMQPDGIGALYIAFEKLKAKLEAEGLFDEEIKKTIPRIPVGDRSDNLPDRSCGQGHNQCHRTEISVCRGGAFPGSGTGRGRRAGAYRRNTVFQHDAPR